MTMNVSSSLHMNDEIVTEARMGARQGQLRGQAPVDSK